MMNDQELDQLLNECFEREEQLEEINRRVMSQLKRAQRRRWLRIWGRAAVFAIVFPLVLLAFFAILHDDLKTAEPSTVTVLSLIWAALILLFMVARIISQFSLRDV